MGVAKFLLGGGHTTTPFGSTTQVVPGGTNYTADAENYFLMAKKDKFDRIFIKTVNKYTAHTAPTLDRTTIDNSQYHLIESVYFIRQKIKLET